MANDTIKLKIDVDDKNSIKSLDGLEKKLGDVEKKLDGIGKLDKIFNDLSKVIKTSNDTLNELGKTSDKSLNEVNKNVKDTAKGVKDLGNKSKGSFSSMSKGIKGVGTAIKSSGIGFLLTIVAALFKLLKENQGVMDFFNKSIKIMEILFSKLLESIEPLKDALTSAFNDPKKAVQELWEVIKLNMINRFNGVIDFYKQSFGVIVDLVKGAGYAIKGMFDDESRKKSEEFFKSAAQGAIDAGESFVQITTGVDNFVGKMIDGGKKIVDVFNDASKSADEYIKRENDLKLAESELNKFISKNKSTIEELKLIRDDENKSIEERLESSNKINSLIDEETKRSIELQKQKIALMKTNKDLTQTTIDDIVEINNAEAKLDDMMAESATKRRENQMINNTIVKKGEQERYEIEKEKERIEQEAHDRVVEKRRQWAEEDINRENENEMRKATNSQERFDVRMSQEQERYEREKENILLTNEEKELLEEEHQRKMAEIRRLYNDEKINENNKIAADELKNEKITKAERVKIVQASFGAMSSIIELYSSFLDMQMKKELKDAEGNEKKQDQIRKKYGREKKNAAITNVIINTASAIMGFVSGYSTIPVAGQPLAIAAAISTAAMGAAQIAAIQAASFRKGGVLNGPSHEQGGILTPFGELEGDEGVINKYSMSNSSLRNMASAANVGGGGVDFSTGDGSIHLSPESISQIVNGYNDKQIFVSETDITDTQNKVKVMESESTI